MKMLKKSILFSFFLLCIINGFAQDTVSNVNDESFMTSNGKIYVVVAVVVVIVVGLFLYLANLDKKISRLENSKKS